MKVPRQTPLSAALTRAREAKGLSQREAIELLAFSRAWLGDIEVGRKTPSLAVLRRMAEVYETDYAKLVQLWVTGNRALRIDATKLPPAVQRALAVHLARST